MDATPTMNGMHLLSDLAIILCVAAVTTVVFQRATRHFLYPVAISVSAITTLSTPWLIRASGRLAEEVDRRLPHKVATYVSLYGSWVQGLKTGPQHQTTWVRVRRLGGWLLLDLLVIAGIATAASLARSRAIAFGQSQIGLYPELGRWILIAVTLLLLAPFMVGAVRISRHVAAALAAEALPSNRGVDLAAAPRRALLVTLQIGILLLAGGPLVSILQPFYPSVPGAAVLTALVLLLAYPLWRSATNLEGHARAGAQVILEALAAQGHSGPAPQSSGQSSEPLLALVPGLGHPAPVTLEEDSPALGRSLKQLGLRGRTGATVIAIKRGESEVVFPEADDVLRLGDLLVLTGTDESIEQARSLLSPTEARQLPLPATTGPDQNRG